MSIVTCARKRPSSVMGVISVLQPGHFIDKHCSWPPGPNAHRSGRKFQEMLASLRSGRTAIAAPSLATDCFSARWTRRTVNVTRTEEVQAIRERAKMLAVAAD